MPSLTTVLVANRGEIAVRIMQTCRRMGLSTVAVFTDVDEKAPHVRFADTAVRLGASRAYLDGQALIAAARRTGADAIHPGFGFLSENPDFAQAVLDAGLIFIGPPPAAIRAMGLKREAKALVGARGVPLVPGSDGGDQSLAALKQAALEVGLPVIFKPSAGGGGKGMKVVRQASELDEAIGSAQREALRAFGDSTLIIERFLERPRHLEVQLLADHHGQIVHLFERECSIQRRHQKIIEETPSPAIDEKTRAEMGRVAVEVARAIGYTNAGTVELIMDEAGRFYFSEMNTRLQVEHRVTELVTGLDLVEQQLRIARGERLGFRQDELEQRGHAVQARLYAEDADNGFLPATGRVLDFWVPPLGGLLVDSGVETGTEVSAEYDPMLAKIIAFGESREQSTGLLLRALGGLSVLGLTTNQRFLQRVLSHPEYRAGRLHTGFIEQHLSERPSPSQASETLAAVAVTLLAADRRRSEAALQVPLGYRNNRFRDASVEYRVGERQVRVAYRAVGERFEVDLGQGRQQWRLLARKGAELRVEDGEGVVHRLRWAQEGEVFFVQTPGGPVRLEEVPRFPPPADEALKGGTIAPMPGKVVKVLVKKGDVVRKGQALLVLEAMKMEQTTVSPDTGAVAEVFVREGEQVKVGQVLVSIDATR